jgi:hypothetical protein
MSHHREGDRADDAPVPPEEDLLGQPDGVGGLAQQRLNPPRGAVRGKSLGQLRQRQHNREHRRSYSGRDDAEERIRGPREDADEQTEAGQHKSDHVDRAGQEEQDGRAFGNTPGIAPALDEQPRADGDASHSAKRYGGAERELAERHARAEAQRRAFEHLQEGDQVADAREDLQPHAHEQPAGSHLADLVGNAVQPGDGEQQSGHERDEDHERDQSMSQAPRGPGRVELCCILDARIVDPHG